MMFQRTRESHLILPVRPQVCGFFKLTAIRPDGRRRPLTDWFSNLITDGGLNQMGTGSWLARCHVGSGSAEPANSDTQLQTFVAQTGTVLSTTHAAQAEAPYYGSITKTYRFGTGVAEGNLSEVGVGWSSASTGPLFSRALIVDGGGSPTTITVLSDEVLDVAYQLRVIPPSADDSYNVVDDGPDGTTHAVVLRASRVTSAMSDLNTAGWGFASDNGFLVENRVSGVGTGSTGSRPRVYNGALGTVTELPTGSSSHNSDGSNTTYDNNSLERVSSMFWDLDRGNVSGGVSAVSFTFTSAGCYQASFDPVIPKDNTKVLTLGAKVVWSRAS